MSNPFFAKMTSVKCQGTDSPKNRTDSPKNRTFDPVKPLTVKDLPNLYLYDFSYKKDLLSK